MFFKVFKKLYFISDVKIVQIGFLKLLNQSILQTHLFNNLNLHLIFPTKSTLKNKSQVKDMLSLAMLMFQKSDQ